MLELGEFLEVVNATLRVRSSSPHVFAKLVQQLITCFEADHTSPGILNVKYNKCVMTVNPKM